MARIITITSFLLILIISFSFHSCNDNSVDNNVVNPNVVTSLSGIITNLSSDARILKTQVGNDSIRFRQTIGPDNYVQINLITPPQNALSNLSESLFPKDITISDPNAKGGGFSLYIFDSTNYWKGYLLKTDAIHNDSVPIPGRYHTGYFYCDRNTNITGTSNFIMNLQHDTLRINYNLNFGRGYNKITTTTKSYGNHLEEYDIFSGEPNESNWYYLEAPIDFMSKVNQVIKKNFD